MSFRALSKPGSKPPQTLCLNVTLLWWSDDCASELLCSSQNLWACEIQFLSLLLIIFLKRGKSWENSPFSCLDSLPRYCHTGVSKTYSPRTQTCKLDVPVSGSCKGLWCPGQLGTGVAKEPHKIGFLYPPSLPAFLLPQEPRFHKMDL